MDTKLGIIRNQLPKGFANWTQFYEAVKGNYLENLDSVIDYIDVELGQKIEIEIDYMKARCFDEMKRVDKM